MERVYNFSSGPASVDESILNILKDNMLNCMGSGMSILEMNHKSEFFGDIINQTSELIRKLMNISDEYDIVYVSGGGSMQFSMIPLNLMGLNHKADYIDTDYWTNYAIEEARKVGDVRIIASSREREYSYVPKVDKVMTNTDSDYVYLCTNNTASGSAYRPYKIPETNSPLVADMTSNFMSENYDINKFGLVFAAAQKNLGPAGLTIVIIRKDLLKFSNVEKIPRILCYDEYVKTNSTFSTPATFSIYMVLEVLKWVDNMGGIAQMSENNKYKSKLLYDYIDNSKLFHNYVCEEDRSIMNVVFTTNDESLDKDFALKAAQNSLVNLSGYQGIGGLRAGIYNGVSKKAVEELIKFMKDYEKRV